MNIKNWEGFYCLSISGMYDALYINTIDKLYCERNYLERDEVGYIANNENAIASYPVSKQVYIALKLQFVAENGYREWSAFYEETLDRLKSKDKIFKHSKEEIRKAINCNLPLEKFKMLVNDGPYETDDYYDFELFMRVFKAYMGGKLNYDYFKNWCILLCNLFCYPHTAEREMFELYAEIANWFDGISFLDRDLSHEEMLAEFRENIAQLKDFNHRRTDILNDKKTLFLTDGVAVFVSFDYHNGGSGKDVYNVFILDTVNCRFNLIYVDDMDYYEDVNYTFCEDIDNLKNKYYGYKLDRTFGQKYIKRRKT